MNEILAFSVKNSVKNITELFISNNTTINQDTAYPMNLRPFESFAVPVLAVIILGLMVFGIIGSILTIYVILSSPRLKKKPFHNMIVSLCCSDFLSALVSWILLHRRTWGFDDFSPVPAVFCKIFFSIDLMTSFTTAMHILYFAVQRYRFLKAPVGNQVHLKLANVWRSLIGIWLLAIITAFVPMWFYSAARQRDRRIDSIDARWPSCTLKNELLDQHRIYQWVVYLLFLVFPAIGILFFTVRLLNLVKSRKTMPTTISRIKEVEEKREKKDKEAKRQLYSIVFMFIIGYAPITSYDFWALRNEDTSFRHQKIDYWFGTVAYIFLRLSEVGNIIIYNYFYPDIWKETKKSLKIIFKIFKRNKKSDEIKSKIKVPTSIKISSKNQSTANDFELKNISRSTT